MPTELVSSDADVRAILADPAYVVPPAPHAHGIGTLAWLRAHVTRFCEGEAHDRRRAMAEQDIAGLDPASLRRAPPALTPAGPARRARSETGRGATRTRRWRSWQGRWDQPNPSSWRTGSACSCRPVTRPLR